MDTILDLMERAAAEHGAHRDADQARLPHADVDVLPDRQPGPAGGALPARQGLEPGDRVLIWAVNRPEWAIAFLGLLCAEETAPRQAAGAADG